MARRGIPMGEITDRIRTADTPRAAASVLKQLGQMGVPHADVWADGVRLTGYTYDEATQRYRRIQKAKNPATETISLNAQAARAGEALRRTHNVQLDKRRAGLQLPNFRPIALEQTTSYLNEATTGVDRAARLRRVLGAASVPLAQKNAQGNWTDMPNGDLKAAGAADVLVQPLNKVEPVLSPVADVSWHPHEIGKMPEAVVWRRREPIADILHPAVVVDRYDERDRKMGSFMMERGFSVVQDTYFMVAPELGDDVGETELVDAVATYGDGMEDIIVPVAGFVTAEQSLQVLRRLG